MANPMRTVSFKLPEELDDALTDLARRRECGRSALVRRRLEVLATTGRRSVTAMVDELIGSVAGPRDLSDQSRHIERLGKWRGR